MLTSLRSLWRTVAAAGWYTASVRFGRCIRRNLGFDFVTKRHKSLRKLRPGFHLSVKLSTVGGRSFITQFSWRRRTVAAAGWYANRGQRTFRPLCPTDWLFVEEVDGGADGGASDDVQSRNSNLGLTEHHPGLDLAAAAPPKPRPGGGV